MTKHAVRLAAQCMTGDESYSMIVDAVLQDGDTGMKISGNTPRCGYFGNLRDTLHPFVLRKEQSPRFPAMGYVMDFGTDFPEDDGHYITNLPSKSIAVGATFTVMMLEADTNKWDEYTYRIRQLTNILSGQALDTL